MATPLNIPVRPNAIALPEHHTDFLQRFVAREENRGRERPAPLSVEEHAVHRKRLAGASIKPKYACETEINVGVVFRKWKRYCEEQEVGEWKPTIENIRPETTMDFLLYVCETSKVESSGSTKVYIRQFQQLYTCVTGRFMDRNDAKTVYKYHNTVLVPRFGLRPPNIDGKPVVSVDELRILLTYNLAYDTGHFSNEGQRNHLHGCYQLMSYTGVRPAELVDNERKKPKDGSLDEIFGLKIVGPADSNYNDGKPPDEDSRRIDELLAQETTGRGRSKALCYEDILMMIVRHPLTGKAIPAMAIKFVHHKGADNKPRPTIFYFTPTKKLIFCAVSTVIAHALRDQAFDAPSLTNASRVLGIKPSAFTQCIPLRWKESMLKIPVFRRFRRGVHSDIEAMLYSTLRDDLAQQSLDAGFEEHWTPRFFRRGTANAANGNAPDAVRDQMMRHDPKFGTFFSAYLNEKVGFDMQNTFLEEETEDQLFRLFAHVSLTRDPRATRDMVPEEFWQQLPPDPDIVALEEKRAQLKQGRYRIQGQDSEAEIRQLTKEIRAKRDEREKRAAKEYREWYFYNRPTWDIERQIRGEVAEEEEEYTEPAIVQNIPERARLAELLCFQRTDLTDEDLFKLRVEAIDLMVTLWGRRETIKSDLIRLRERAELPMKGESPEPNPFPLLMDMTQCPDCFGDERLTLRERTFRYCRPTVRNDHFDDAHLEERERAEQRGELQVCRHRDCKGKKFHSMNHFRNHVQSVHKVSLRTQEQVEQRRSRKAKIKQLRRRG